MTPFFVIIQGATGTGKSNIAEQLAEELDGEIISADSRQIYKHLDIGTAKPDFATRQKFKYHLVDFIDPHDTYNAGQFRKNCQEQIHRIISDDRLPIVAGGTGFYISALINGLAEVPEVNEYTKKEVEKYIASNTPQQIHDYLTIIDPASAERIEINDIQRQMRALEVFKQTGKPLSTFWKNHNNGIDIPFLNILVHRNRGVLYDRINKRVDLMLDHGLIAEFLSAVQKGYSADDPGMKSVGYRELFPWLKNELTLSEAIDKIKQHSRNYAKRQFTWYRKQDFHLTFDLEEVSFSFIKENIKKYYKKVNDDCSKSQ